FDEFCLWCALSLEVLGKAMLARVHPSLVADARNAENLFMACGQPVRPEHVGRSIGAADVFQRLKLLSPKRFDSTHNEFCSRSAERRNAHLHSGERPFEALPRDEWAASFWRAAQAILSIHGLTLADWVGAAEASRV